MHQSCGGMSGDGSQSYAATVISAAKVDNSCWSLSQSKLFTWYSQLLTHKNFTSYKNRNDAQGLLLITVLSCKILF